MEQLSGVSAAQIETAMAASGSQKREWGLIFTFDIAFSFSQAGKSWPGRYGLNLKEPFTI